MSCTMLSLEYKKPAATQNFILTSVTLTAVRCQQTDWHIYETNMLHSIPMKSEGISLLLLLKFQTGKFLDHVRYNS
jgi:hypothetical protein